MCGCTVDVSSGNNLQRMDSLLVSAFMIALVVNIGCVAAFGMF